MFYATMTACEVAYSTYIYAKVDKTYYQKVTSHMRAAALTGRFTSALLAQVLLSFNILDVASLNHITFIGRCTFISKYKIVHSPCCFSSVDSQLALLSYSVIAQLVRRKESSIHLCAAALIMSLHLLSLSTDTAFMQRCDCGQYQKVEMHSILQ